MEYVVHLCRCGKRAMFVCGGCIGEWYCSKECQMNHWMAYHRLLCGNSDVERGGFLILRKLLKLDPGDKTFVISPVSLSSAFGVLMLMEDDAVRSELEKFFGEPTRNQEVSRISASSVNSCNSIWFADNDRMDDRRMSECVNKAKSLFDATIEKGLDVARINSWISEKTRGMITHMVDSISKDVKVMIINALMFDCKWKKPFDEELSKDDSDFHRSDGSIVKCRMMNNPKLRTRILFREDGYGAILDLVDQKAENNGYHLSILVAMMKDGTCPSESFVRHVAEEAAIETVNITLPITFTSFGPEDVLEILKDLGAKKMSEIGHISFDPLLCVSNVLHCAKLKFDEKGAKGAAATIIMMEVMAAFGREAKPNVMIFDRPFFVGVIIESMRRVPPIFAFASFVRNPIDQKW